MKSRSEIWLKALEELSAKCSVSTSRDGKTVTERVKKEGESFFTLTLPAFARDFEQSLARQEVPLHAYQGWKRSDFAVNWKVSPQSSDTFYTEKHAVGVPVFLGAFLDLIFTRSVDLFDYSDDDQFIRYQRVPRLRRPETVDEIVRQSEAVAAVRQLTLMFAKEKELCSESKQQDAVRQYEQTDQELEDPFVDASGAVSPLGNLHLERLQRIIHVLFGEQLLEVERMIYASPSELIPKHGPGKTADRLDGNRKWKFRVWTERLDSLFPYWEWCLPNERDQTGHPVKLLKPEDEMPSRLKLVPKTQKSPRPIALEPTHMQYVQQALMRALVPLLESHRLSGVFLGFTEQWPNQAMAQIGSEDGSLATLDLSEASDRVGYALVKHLFSRYRLFLEAIDVSRSRSVRLPDGRIMPLKKFASMGSAMTFPLEAMVFTAVAIDRILLADGKSITAQSMMSLADTVRVYGDDIIVPTGHAETVIDGLESLGFKVNRDKSFWTGKFRESCGKEYWEGFDVSIVKFRKRLPASLRDAEEVVSTVETRNQLFAAGLTKTAELLDEFLEPLLHGRYPVVLETSPILGRVINSQFYQIDFMDDELHAPRVEGYAVRAELPENRLNGYAALLKCLVSVTGTANPDTEHLKRSGRPHAVVLKRVKASPF